MRAAAAALGRRRLPRPAFALRAPGPRLRLGLLILLLLCLALAAGYRFWLRDSSLVAVEEVRVSGLTTKDAERVRTTLASAGQTMTTLNVDRASLEESVEHYPVVRALEISADFPHGLEIRVVEHHPAALVEIGGDEVPVAGDGTLLRGMPVERRLPAIDTEVRSRGERLTSSAALHAARVAGAAPAVLQSRIETIEVRDEDGVIVLMHEGPELIFGDGTRAEAKWIAATRVLADPEAEGATYIDVRLPGRPAAAGLPTATVAPAAPAVTPVAPATGATPADTAAGITPGAPATTPAVPVPATPVVPAAPAGGAVAPSG